MTLIYSAFVTAGYSHPCDTQHVLLLAAAGWNQPQGPISSRAGSCLLLPDIFGNRFCIPSSFLLASPGWGGVEFLATTMARLVQRFASRWGGRRKKARQGGGTQKWVPARKITTTEIGFGDRTSSWQAGTCKEARPSTHAGFATRSVRHGNSDAVPIKLWTFGFNGN